MARARRRRNVWFAAVTVLGSVLLTLGAMEAVFRALGIDGRPLPPRRVDVLTRGEWQTVGYWGTTPLKRPSPFPEVRMGEYIPDLTFRFVYLDRAGRDEWRPRAVEAHINRYGLRGPALPREKAPGVFRILALGDSFTFGEGVADHEPFIAQLTDLLNESPAGPRFEAINAGVSGYNTRDEVLYLEHRWLGLDPDLILLTFYLNDAYDDARFGPLVRGGATGATVDRPLPEPGPVRVLEWAGNTWRRWRAGREIARIYRSQFSDNPEIDGHDWTDSRNALARAALLARQRNIRLVLVLFPELHELDGDYPFENVHRRVREAAEELGIPVLDLLGAFRGRDATELWVHPTDHHPNARAHAIAARAIADFLAGARLLPL